MSVAIVERAVGIGMTYQPTNEDNQYLNDLDQGYIGMNKPKIIHEYIPYDWASWARYKASKELGIPEEDMADEPDEMGDHSDEQPYDEEK